MSKFLYRFPLNQGSVKYTTTQMRHIKNEGITSIFIKTKDVLISDLSSKQQVVINKLIKKLKRDKKDFVISSDLEYFYIKSV